MKKRFIRLGSVSPDEDYCDIVVLFDLCGEILDLVRLFGSERSRSFSSQSRLRVYGRRGVRNWEGRNTRGRKVAAARHFPAHTSHSQKIPSLSRALLEYHCWHLTSELLQPTVWESSYSLDLCVMRKVSKEAVILSLCPWS